MSQHFNFLVGNKYNYPLTFSCKVTIIASFSDGFTWASHFGSHMVLQRAPQRAVVWGYAPKEGATVSVLLTRYGWQKRRGHNEHQHGYTHVTFGEIC